MIRGLKILGLVVFAVTAVTAVTASGASAQVFASLTTGETPVTHTSSKLTGEQFGNEAENKFTTTAGEHRVSCTNTGVNYTGKSPTGTATSVTLEPTYTQCLADGSLPVKVTTNGCQYELTHPETIVGLQTYTGKLHLRCPAGQTIVIHVFLNGTLHNEAGYNTTLCTIKIGEQNPGGHIVYHGNTNVEVTPGVFRDDVTMTGTVTEITYDEEGLCGAHHGTDGTFNSNLTFKGTNTSGTEHHDVWLSD